MSSNVKVALIGCGPAGISVLSAFNQLEKNGEPIPEIVCFEKQDTIGGLWNYTWHTGTDKYGEQCHNSMYRYLWGNNPKEVLEHVDYTFAEHFAKPISSFPPRAAISDYIDGRAKKNGIHRFVRLHTIVRHVEQKGNQFVLTSQDLKSKRRKQETFDYLVIATGHYSVPNVPIYPGIDEFEGEILHCHDLRDAAKYKGKKVLLIGNGYSAEDVAIVCYKYGVQQVTISYRTKPTQNKWPNSIKEIPQLVKFENGFFHFKDDSMEKFDVLIFCTGYQYHFPYLPDELRLEADNRFYIAELYKGVVFNKCPRVFYMGMHNQNYTFTMFDVQGCFARDVILGKIDVKSECERLEDIETWMERLRTLKNEHDDVNFQKDYLLDLLKFCDYSDEYCVKRAEYLHQWKDHREENILTYRDKSFTSLITKDVASRPAVPWFENMEDSLEGYMKSLLAN